MGVQQEVTDEKDVSAKQYQKKEDSRFSWTNEHQGRTKRSQAKENERKETTHGVGSKSPDDGGQKRIIQVSRARATHPSPGIPKRDEVW